MKLESVTKREIYFTRETKQRQKNWQLYHCNFSDLWPIWSQFECDELNVLNYEDIESLYGIILLFSASVRVPLIK